jgi:UDP-N-acetylmuramoyl-tripeptide--D-alanyl-D-alanine ligase
MAMNAAMAMATGIELGIDPQAAAEALQKVQLPSGRVRLEKHKAGWLLDDSYNANPDSLGAAVATLESLPGQGRAVALLGAMAELGSFSRMLHEESGSMIARSQTALCFAVGADSKFLVEAAQKVRAGEWARWFTNRDELLAAYRREAKSDDRILVKGSRSQQMDLVAAELRKGS